MTNAQETKPDSDRRRSRTASPSPRRDGVGALIVKVLFLGVVIGVAIALTPDARRRELWVFLVAIWVIAAILVATYATGRALPAKYLVPGTADAGAVRGLPDPADRADLVHQLRRRHPHTKEETVAQIVGSSVVADPEDSPHYNLTVATDGPRDDRPVHLLPGQPGRPSRSSSGHRGGPRGARRRRRHASRTARSPPPTATRCSTPSRSTTPCDDLDEFTVPTEDGAIIVRSASARPSRARTTLEYDEDADTITDVTTGTVYTVQQQGDREFFVDENGNRRLRPVLEGQRRLRQLQEDPHRPRDQQRLHQHLHLDVPLRDAVGGLDVPPRSAARDHAQRPADARPEDLPGAADPAVRHSRVHLAAGVVQLLQPRLRPDQRPDGLEHQLVRRHLERPGRGAAHEPVDGLPLHVPGVHRCPAGDPVGPARGGQDRRRQRLQAPAARSSSR